MRAPRTKSARGVSLAAFSVRLDARVALETSAYGEITACFQGYSISLGTFSAAAADRARKLRKGLPFADLAPSGGNVHKEINLLARRLAKRGLLRFRLGASRGGEDLVIVEPQTSDYWPVARPLANTDALVLSRFAYMRRRGDELVLESPRAGALFKICDPKIATTLAMLSGPKQIKHLRREDGFPGMALLALLADCQILLKTSDAERGRRRSRSLGVSRSSVPRPRHGRPTRQPAGRNLPPRRRHFSAAGAAARLARAENRTAGARGDLPLREAPARTSLDARLRRPATDRIGRAFTVP